MTFYFGSVWKGNVDNRRMLPYDDPSAWMPFLLPWRTPLRHYMPTTAFYWLRRLSTREKMNTFIFRRSRIEAESTSNWSQSQSNHNFHNYVAVESKSNRSRIEVKSKLNRNCNSHLTCDTQWRFCFGTKLKTPVNNIISICHIQSSKSQANQIHISFSNLLTLKQSY